MSKSITGSCDKVCFKLFVCLNVLYPSSLAQSLERSIDNQGVVSSSSCLVTFFVVNHGCFN